MNKILLLVFGILVCYSCKQEAEIDKNYIIDKFQESTDNIKVLEYRLEKIDSIGYENTVYNDTGFTIIEIDKDDELFGFSFYGKRDDIPKKYIYNNGNAYIISDIDKAYEVKFNEIGFLGKPGGQMVNQSFFRVDTVYKSLNFTETERSYVLKYKYEDDSIYNISEIKKTIELDKTNFLPISIKTSSVMMGEKNVSISKFDDIKINENVTSSIKEKIEDINDFNIIQPQKTEPNPLLLTKISPLKLPNLQNQDKIVEVNFDKLTLIDFWEVWCSPCIASFPKVEKLKNKYATGLKVTGMVSEDLEKAVELIEIKKTSFQNLIGNQELKNKFRVYGYPRYLLIDKNGIFLKEYFGFSEQIEKDIDKFLAKG